MDVIMHEWKKRRLFLVLISALVALAVIIAALVLILAKRRALSGFQKGSCLSAISMRGIG